MTSAGGASIMQRAGPILPITIIHVSTVQENVRKKRPGLHLFGEYLAVQCYARREIETDPSVRSDAWAITLKQMVDSVYHYPSCMGGAIWAAIDDIFHLSEDRICGYGPWGPIDGWRREKPEYIGMKKSYSPVIITNLYTANVVNRKIKLDVENRYNFSNLNELKINVKTGSHIFPLHADIAPMSKGSIIIDLTRYCPEDKLEIIFTDPRGFICQEEVIQIGQTATSIVSKVKVKLVLAQDGNRHIIKSGETTFIISKATGTLECITSGGEKVISAGGSLMMVPFNNDDGGAPHVAFNNYTQDIQSLEYIPFESFKVKSIIPMQKADSTVYVKLSGELEHLLEGSQEYIFNTDGTVTVSYDYMTLTDFTKNNLLRQFGLLFTLPISFDRLSWERKGLWTVYPEYDINRLKGSAKALPRDLKYVEVPREVPIGEWKDNANKLGTNDFKSTKGNIIRASLKNDNNIEVIVKADGSQSARSWIDGQKIRFLIAGLNGPGSCGFFIGPRPEFKKGDHLKGKFILGIQ